MGTRSTCASWRGVRRFCSEPRARLLAGISVALVGRARRGTASARGRCAVLAGRGRPAARVGAAGCAPRTGHGPFSALHRNARVGARARRSGTLGGWTNRPTESFHPRHPIRGAPPGRTTSGATGVYARYGSSSGPRSLSCFSSTWARHTPRLYSAAAFGPPWSRPSRCRYVGRGARAAGKPSIGRVFEDARIAVFLSGHRRRSVRQNTTHSRSYARFVVSEVPGATLSRTQIGF
jgi:hypothetical protein